MMAYTGGMYKIRILEGAVRKGTRHGRIGHAHLSLLGPVTVVPGTTFSAC
jgi:hypothetical protein